MSPVAVEGAFHHSAIRVFPVWAFLTGSLCHKREVRGLKERGLWTLSTCIMGSVRCIIHGAGTILGTKSQNKPPRVPLGYNWFLKGGTIIYYLGGIFLALKHRGTKNSQSPDEGPMRGPAFVDVCAA